MKGSCPEGDMESVLQGQDEEVIQSLDLRGDIMVTFSTSGSVGLKSHLQNEADRKGLEEAVSHSAWPPSLRSF